MRRKLDSLIPIEAAILEASLVLRRRGMNEFHGYLIAKFIKHPDEARRFVAQGTLYRALDRLQTRGFLVSRWEAPEDAIAESRPARRLYTLTDAGRQACIAHRAIGDLRPGLRPVWKLT